MSNSSVIFLHYVIFVICVIPVNGLHSRQKIRDTTTVLKAIAVIRGDTVNGIIHFIQDNEHSSTKISGEIKGLSPGLHGFHIHEYGDTTNGCVSAGAHFNPHNFTHGGPTDSTKHIGDLGNIEVGNDGIARVNIMSSDIKLSGPLSIVGRSVVVHADPDDLGKGTGNKKQVSLKTGNAGMRIACGIVGVAKAI